MKLLILYYSYSGNTRKIAEMIREQTGGDMAEIETVQPYPADYDAVVAQAKREVNAGFKPKIKPLAVSVDDYDTVAIGTPVWWYTYAPPLQSALSGQNWEGKTVHPFATHGGGPGQTLENIKKSCAGAEVKPGLDIYFSGQTPRKSAKEINDWISGIR